MLRQFSAQNKRNETMAKQRKEMKRRKKMQLEYR